MRNQPTLRVMGRRGRKGMMRDRGAPRNPRRSAIERHDIAEIYRFQPSALIVLQDQVMIQVDRPAVNDMFRDDFAPAADGFGPRLRHVGELLDGLVDHIIVVEQVNVKYRHRSYNPCSDYCSNM